MIYPHGNIESIADDVYMVRGSIKMNALLRITRNMALVKEGESLEAEFRSLLELQFDKLLSAHGTLIENGAHAAVLKAVDTAFAKTES